jgi:SAM-dependent methyltransferase
MVQLWAPKIYNLKRSLHVALPEGFKALDVGCGDRKLTGAVGMDALALPAVDVVHDIDQTPWPFVDESFDLVFLNHALEHVKDVISTMGEIHRVCKPGAHVVIQVPYFRSVDAYTDPTHKHFFTSGTLDYVIEGTALAKYRYNEKRFRRLGFWYGWPHPSQNPVTRLVKSWMHASPSAYDRYLSRLFVSRCVTWELEKIG